MRRTLLTCTLITIAGCGGQTATVTYDDARDRSLISRQVAQLPYPGQLDGKVYVGVALVGKGRLPESWLASLNMHAECPKDRPNPFGKRPRLRFGAGDGPSISGEYFEELGSNDPDKRMDAVGFSMPLDDIAKLAEDGRFTVDRMSLDLGPEGSARLAEVIASARKVSASATQNPNRADETVKTERASQ